MHNDSFLCPSEVFRAAVLKQRLAEALGNTDLFDIPNITVQRVTVTDTVSETAGYALGENEASCVKCGASYGHTASCPTFNREAAEEERRIDAFFLKSLRISID